MELLENRQNQDLYRLGQELQLEVDDILPIVEAAKLMDLIDLQQGDIYLKPIAFQFIEGNIDERKEIIRTQLMNHIRLVQQIFNLLQAKQNQRIPEELILDILQNHFSPNEAQRQLNTAIDWARYGELFSYDEPSVLVFISL
ncbi:AAA-associated domain-containing protein [Aphanothece hegewaldii]|uniref:AAA-associated domain-containing protein n=1 Tax=Aphanothece hegewaldii TaxID=1521625 RepID=UPI001C625238|nr:AAA-associated domain-containing protein [Aphanothece hegewaldii]